MTTPEIIGYLIAIVAALVAMGFVAYLASDTQQHHSVSGR